MNYADIKTVDIQDGTGVRVSIYVSGCHFHCKGCHNKEAWDFNYGKKFDDSTIEYILDAMNYDYIAGLSILGGEPLELVNQQGLVKLVEKVKEKYMVTGILTTGSTANVKIIADAPPFPQAKPVQPDVEDAYMYLMAHGMKIF